MRYIKTALLLFVCLLPALPAAALSVEQELMQLREDVTFLQRQVYQDRSSGGADISSSKNTQVRLGEFDQLLRDVIGKTDELEHRIKKLNQKLDTMNKDIDVRFKLLEGKPVSTGAGVGAAAAKFEAPVAKNAPKAITGDQIKGDSLKPVKGSDVKEIYQSGLEALKVNDNKKAEKVFSLILVKFPNDKLAGNAQYWLGEVYYGRKDFAKAAIAFAKGYEKYKTGPKGADSLLKLGMSMRELKKTPEACAAFTSLAKEFPKAEKAVLDRSAAEAKKLNCK